MTERLLEEVRGALRCDVHNRKTRAENFFLLMLRTHVGNEVRSLLTRTLDSSFYFSDGIIPSMWVVKVPLELAYPMVIGDPLHVLHCCKPV